MDKKGHPNIWEKISKNNGFFTVETLPYITKGELIQKYLLDFQRHISDNDLSIVKINDSNVLFQLLNSDYRSGLSFEVDIAWFMKNIGCYCLTDKNYKYGKEELSSRKDIPLNSRNLTEVINRLNYNLKDIGYEIVVSERINQLYYKRLREIVTKNKFSSKAKIKKQAYAKVSDYVLLSDFSSFIFETNEFIKKKYKGKFGILECRDNIWMDEESKILLSELQAKLLQCKTKGICSLYIMILQINVKDQPYEGWSPVVFSSQYTTMSKNSLLLGYVVNSSPAISSINARLFFQHFSIA